MQVCTVNYEIFVPREIVFDICSEPDHLNHWFEAIARTEILKRDKPAQLTFRIADENTGTTSDVTLNFTDLRGTTRIDIEQKGQFSAAEMQRLVKEWQTAFARMENYLSSI